MAAHVTEVKLSKDEISFIIKNARHVKEDLLVSLKCYELD